MSIYVGTSEIKNVYIGTTPVKEVYVGTTKVRPSGIHISSDLRGTTLAGLQAQGWNGIATRFSSYVLNSSGLAPSSTHGDVAFLYKNINLSNAKKIQIKVTGYMTGNGSNYGNTYQYMTNSISFPTSFNSYLGSRYSPGYNNIPSGILYNGSLLSGSPTNASGKYNSTLDINLESGLLSYNISSPVSYSTTYTLNSTQLSTIKGYNYIGVMPQIMNGSTQIVYTVDLTVE